MVHLRRARDLMDLHFSDPLDLDQLAAQAGFSKFQFSRSFKDAYGETPANYLSRRRVERAKDLLRSANLTVTEVCMLVGCSSLGSFSSRFSEMVGMSPSAFQKASAARGGRSSADSGVFSHGLGTSPPSGLSAGAQHRIPDDESAISEKRVRGLPSTLPTMITRIVAHERLRAGPRLRQGLLHRQARIR